MAGPAMGSFAAGALSARAVAGIAAAGFAAITALYLLRLRRRRVAVAYAALWLGGAGDARAAGRARRLRQWVSLSVALATFAALLVGAADPRPTGGGQDGQNGRSIVVLIDRSASMSATDEPGGRLAAAKARAAALVAGLAPSDRALIASFAADAQAESGFESPSESRSESDDHVLADAIARVGASDETADLPRALAFGAALLRGRARPTIVLVSDGGFGADDRRFAPDGVDIRYIPVGRRADNVGIVAFGARRAPADPGTVEVALSLASFRREPSQVPLEIWTRGRLVERRNVSLPPGQTTRIVLDDVFVPEATVEARLPIEDDLAADNRAVATIPPLPRRRVLRVGGPDLFLDGALLSLGRTVGIDRLPAEEADRAVALAPRYDLIVLDGAMPSVAPTAGRFLIFDPHDAGSPFAARGVVRDPVLDPASVRRDHPLLRGVDLADVNIAETRRIVPARDDVVLVGSFGLPLVLARARPGLRVVALAFDPRRSDLPMRPAFPLLVANALAWAAEDTTNDTTNEAHRQLGAVTRRDARESDTTPVASLELAGRRLAAPDPAYSNDSALGHRRGRAATWALLLAALLLLAEAVSYHRRWTT